MVHTTTTASAADAMKRRLDVAILGLPNAGKSQLVNIFTQSTVSAVSRKRHTTRQGVLGARTIGDKQLLFFDTPGFLRVGQMKKEGLDHEWRKVSRTEMEFMDHSLLVVDAARRMTDDVKETIIELMLMARQSQGRLELDDDDDFQGGESSHVNPNDAATKSKFSVVLNKVDLVHPKSDLLDLAQELSDMAVECLQYKGQTHVGEPVIAMTDEELQEHLPMFFYISALKEVGTDDLLNYILDLTTPTHGWEVEAGESTSLTPEERVEEVVREKIYRCLHKELPYQLRQRNTLFQVKKDASSKLGVLIHQEIIATTKSHAELVRGTGGRTLERIRETAERDLTKILQCSVVLQLSIKLTKSRRRIA